jgi:hypothetical protein
MSAIAQALTDKDFLTAQPDDQKAYLAHIDPDFAKASPEDQAAYHAAVVLPAVKQNSLKLNAQPTQFEKERPGVAHVNQPGQGFLSHVGSGLKSVAGGLANLPMSPNEITSSVAGQAGQMGADAAARQQEGRSTAYQIAAPIAQTVVPGLNPRGMEEAANVGDKAGIMGETVAPAAMAVAPLVKEGAGVLRGKVGEAIHTPTGELKPIAKYVGQIGGGAAGGAYGALHASPYEALVGGAAGYKFGPKLIEGAFPFRPSPEFPGAPLPAASDFYAHEGAERNAIRTKNEALNRQQAREAARQEKLQPIPTDTPTPISPGAPLPSANDFYAKEGAERNAILARGEGEKPASPEFPGAHLPSMEDFYSKRGEELNAIRRRGINEPKPAAGEVGPASTVPSPEVMHFPEPRALQPGDKPGSMYSIPRDELTGAAQRGAPGAGDVLRNINKPIIYTPREGVGYPGPRTEPPPTLPPTVTAAHQPEVAKLETPATEGPQPVGVRKVGTANDRPQVPYKGGINEKGVEASMRTISPEDMVTGLSTEVQRMTDTLRNSPGRPAAEKAQMQQQIDQYQQRLDELRKSAQTKGAAQRAERQRVATLRSGRVF